MLTNPWVLLSLILVTLMGSSGLYLKGRHDGKESILVKQERAALKLKATQDPALADLLTTYIFGAQDDAKLISLIESAVDGVCSGTDSPRVPKATPSPADKAHSVKVAAAVKADLAAGVACHRQLTALIDAAVIAGATKP